MLANNSIYPRLGRLYAVNRSLNEKTGKIAVIVTFPNPEGQLPPGQFARIRVTTQERPDAVLIPQVAVVRSPGTTAAYVIAAANKVQLRSIALGPEYEDFFVVNDGLSGGERVVTRARSRFSPARR